MAIAVTGAVAVEPRRGVAADDVRDGSVDRGAGAGRAEGASSRSRRLPATRGRGCYRALVRARWDAAVELGTPGLAVQAQYGTSFPILRRLGFVEVATVHTLQ